MTIEEVLDRVPSGMGMPYFCYANVRKAALGPYLRPWPLGAALTWGGVCGMALLYTGDGDFLELGVFGAPIIGVVGGVIYMLTFRRT